MTADEFAETVAVEAEYSVVFTSFSFPQTGERARSVFAYESLLFKIVSGVEAGCDGSTNKSVTGVTYTCLSLWVKRG